MVRAFSLGSLVMAFQVSTMEMSLSMAQSFSAARGNSSEPRLKATGQWMR